MMLIWRWFETTLSAVVLEEQARIDWEAGKVLMSAAKGNVLKVLL